MIDKEELKKKRKELYREAKKKRDADPAFIAYKQKLKDKRKALYRQFKDKQKKEKDAAKQEKQLAKEAALKLFFKDAKDL